MGWFSNFLDDVVGLDPNGGGIYGAARDVLGDTIADDVLGMDPNGGGAISAYNIAIPAIAGYYGMQALGPSLSGGSAGASSGTGLSAGGSGLGMTGSGYLGLQAPASAMGSTAAASSIPGWLSSLGGTAANYLSSPSNLTALASVAGGLLGSSKAATGSNASQQYRMDSRLDPYVYGVNGSGGLLTEAASQYKKQMANGGLNDLQRQGIEMQRQALTSPQYAQGYDAMRSQGLGLLNGGIAGNPFSQFDENSYLQNKLKQLQDPSEKAHAESIGWNGGDASQLKQFMAMHGLTPIQHYNQFGRNEGVAANPYSAALGMNTFSGGGA